jgi:hypothetical protein
MRTLSTRVAGLLILVLGLWGALVPFVGPYFHFTLGPTKSWTWTSGRLWLDVLPGVAAVVGGLMLLRAGPRPGGKIGALLALAAGVWFAIGPDASLLWNAGGAQGAAHGSVGIRVLEMITYHTALGVVIAALASFALPGLFARRPAVVEAGAGADEAALAEHETAVRPSRRDVDEPVGAGEPTAVDHQPGTAGEPTAAVNREPAGVGASAAGDRAEYAAAGGPTPDRNGIAVAEHDRDYGADTGPSPTAGTPATTRPAAMSAPVAGTEVRRRRRCGLLPALRR